MRRNVFGTTPESTSPTIVSLNDQKISATHSFADLNLCATIQKKSKVYCVLFFKLTCRIIYARLYSNPATRLQSIEAPGTLIEWDLNLCIAAGRSRVHRRDDSIHMPVHSGALGI